MLFFLSRSVPAWAIGSSFAGLLHPLAHPIVFFFRPLSYFLVLHVQAHLLYSCPFLEPAISLLGLWVLLLENGIRTLGQGRHVLIAPGLSGTMLWGRFSKTGKREATSVLKFSEEIRGKGPEEAV